MRSFSIKSARPVGVMAIVFSTILMALFAIFIATTVQAQSKEEAPQANEHLISVHSNGQTRAILTDADTLRDAFKQAGIDINEHDLVEPSLDQELITSQYDVNVYRARPITIVDGAVKTKVITPYQTEAQIARHAGIKLQDEDTTQLTADMDMKTQSAGIRMHIDRATAVTLVLYGKKVQAYTQGETVAELLKEKEIILGGNDMLSVKQDAPIREGMKIELWREGKQTVTEEKDVDFSVEQVRDTDRPAGFKEVKTPGEKGKRTVSYEVVMKNGKEVSRKEIRSVTTKQPKKQVEVIGVKFNYTGGPLNDEQITFLGNCESGMTATRNSGNGFYGAFQFMPATWRNAAPSGFKDVLPHEAPLDAQKQAVQNLLSGSNIFNQFPGCAKQMRAKGIL